MEHVRDKMCQLVNGEGWLISSIMPSMCKPSTKQKSTNIHYKVIIVSLKNSHGFQLSIDSLFGHDRLYISELMDILASLHPILKSWPIL